MLVYITLLVVVGLLMMFSASYANAYFYKGSGSYYIERQAIFAVFGFVAMLIISFIPYTILHRFAWLFFLASWVLLFLTLFMEPINGARRWIIIANSFTLQPSELVKFAVILLFAHLIARQPDKLDQFNLGFFRFALILASIALVTLNQTHVSGTILIFGIGAIVMFAGGVRLRYFLYGGAMAIPILTFLIFTVEKFKYALQRVLTNVNGGEASVDAYQINQSLIAIGSGGLFGLGLGNSRQKQMYVPEAQNDFVFSIIVEELGFIGALLIILLFVLFVVRGVRISLNAKDKFGALLAAGIVGQVALQSALNMAVVTALVPNTGISLPFFSQGGTSLFILLCEMGVLLSVARYSYVPKMETIEEEEGEE